MMAPRKTNEGLRAEREGTKKIKDGSKG